MYQYTTFEIMIKGWPCVLVCNSLSFGWYIHEPRPESQQQDSVVFPTFLAFLQQVNY